MLEESGFVFLVDYHGLNVDQLTELRGLLRNQRAGLTVTKNSLTLRAASELGWPELSDVALATALVYGGGDPSAVAKLLRTFRKSSKLSAPKAGWFEGAALSGSEIEELADIPPREVLLGIFVRTVAAPMSGLVGVLQQKVASLVYVLKAIEEKKSQ